MNHSDPEFPLTFYNESSTSNQAARGAAATQPLASAPNGITSQDVALTILRIFLPVIIFLGTVGNLLSIAVLTRRALRMVPVFFYLTLLSVADTLVLYVSGFKSWIRLITSYELLHSSDVVCRALMYIILCALYLSSWLIVILTVDRFVVIFFPFRGYVLLRIRQARITALCLAVTVALYNLHALWSYRLGVNRLGQLKCDMDEDDWFMYNVFDYLKLVSYSCVPFLIVITLNVCVIVKISQQSKRFVVANIALSSSSASTCSQRRFFVCRSAAGRQQQHPRLSTVSFTDSSTTSFTVSRMRQTRLTLMLLAISFVWLVLTGPFTVYALFVESTRRRYDMLTKTICFLLMYINHASNFYLYCITGQRFRNELRNMIVRLFVCTRLRAPHRATRTAIPRLRVALSLK